MSPLAERDLQSIWERLKKALEEITRSFSGGYSLEELYRCSYTMLSDGLLESRPFTYAIKPL